MTGLANSPVNGDNADAVQGADSPAAIGATELVKYEAARRALAEAHQVDEVKDIRNKAVAMQVYARQAKDHELIEHATEIRMRAERRLGEMMAEQPKNEGGRPKTGLSENPVSERPVTLAQAGIDKNLANRARKAASLSEGQFEQKITQAKKVAVAAIDRATIDEKREARDVPKITNTMGRQQPTRRKPRGAAVEGLDPPRHTMQPELPLNPPPEPVEAAAKSENQEPTFSDEDAPAADAPRLEAGAAPPEPAEASQPPDPTRDFLANILGAVAALSRVPADADFNRMAAIIDPIERERRGKDLDTAAGIVRRLRFALMSFDLERGDQPALPPAAA